MEQHKQYLNNQVSETLFLPLVSRFKAFMLYPHIFPFRKDGTLLSNLKVPINKYDLKIMSTLGTGLRQRMLHQETMEYLQDHPEAIVVNIGCGLDRYMEGFPIDKHPYYNVDLPEVIDFRNQWLPAGFNEHNVAASFLEEEFFEAIPYDAAKGAVFLMSGLVYYFSVKKIRNFVDTLGERCPSARLVFDAGNPMSCKVNTRNIRKLGLGEVSMPWHVTDTSIYETFTNRAKSVRINHKWLSYLPAGERLSFFHKMLVKFMELGKGYYAVIFDF